MTLLERTGDPDGQVLRLLLAAVDFDRFLAEHPDVDREAVEEYRRQSVATQPSPSVPRGGSLVLSTDGASLGNPGPAGIGAVLADADGTVLAEVSEPIGRATNNVAEYRALLRGLEEARAFEAADLRILSDSELMVRQITGVYRVKDPTLRELHRKVRAALSAIPAWKIEAVPRERNSRADVLAEAGARRAVTPGGRS